MPSSRATWRSASPSARSGSPRRRTCRGSRPRSAPSSRGSRSSACSSIRTPPRAESRPTRATATTWTSCSRAARCPVPRPGGPARRHAPRGRRGDARDHRAALADDEPARGRVGAADRDDHDQARRGAAAPAAGRDGRRDHLDRRRDEAGHLLRRARRPGPRGLGRQLPARDARRHEDRHADDPCAPDRPAARRRRARVPRDARAGVHRARGDGGGRRSTSAARRACFRRSASRSCRRSTS